MVASEVHRGRDIGAVLGQHRVRAGLRGPGIGPAEGLGQGDTVTDVEGIPQVLEQLGAPRAAGVGRARGKGRLHLHQTPANALAELGPLRWVGPARLAGPDTSDRLPSTATRGASNKGRQRQRSQPFQYHASLHFRNLRVVGSRRRNARTPVPCFRTPFRPELENEVESMMGRPNDAAGWTELRFGASRRQRDGIVQPTVRHSSIRLNEQWPDPADVCALWDVWRSPLTAHPGRAGPARVARRHRGGRRRTEASRSVPSMSWRSTSA